MPSRYKGAKHSYVSGVTGGSQELTVLEAEMSLIRNERQKHPIVIGPEALCILSTNYHRKGYLKGPKVLVGFWYSCLGDGGH